MALVPSGRAAISPDGSPVGYGPATLQTAYGLTTIAAEPGNSETVAIVDAYDDPKADSDLAAYRSAYGLPACTTASGCLKIVNQFGGGSLPGTDRTGGWELEESVDLEMVSAICPNCKIELVEANSDSISDLATAERYATLSANVVSNSWGSGAEFVGENSFDSDFYRPGVAITAAAGDDGYGTQFPAASPYVTAIGGTTLTGASASSTGTQTAWSGTGSGCASLEPQPSWQQGQVPAGCQNRTDVDLSADANPDTGVAVYDNNPPYQGWVGQRVGGTSVSTPIVAAAYALADIAEGGSGAGLIPGTFPAAYPYQSGGFTDVTAGSNGSCEAGRAYLCHAGTGYDGPTGLGTPDGTAGLFSARGDVVTVINPGTQVYQAGSAVSLPIAALDTNSGGNGPDYAATGLPAGLLMSSGGISGTAPARPGTYRVTVTVTDSADASAEQSVRFNIVIVAKFANTHPGYGPVRLDLDNKCLTDAGNSSASGARAQIDTCTPSAAQTWSFSLGAGPAGAGLVRIHGKCLTIRSGAGATLQSCTGAGSQRWQYQAGNQLYNTGSGKCLADPKGSKSNGQQAQASACTGAADQSWTLPAGPVLSGLAGKCLTDPGDSASTGTRVVISACNGSSAQKWTMGRSGTLSIRGKCLKVAGGSVNDGAAARLAACGSSAAMQWTPGPHGQLFNANSGRCLADPANTATNGAKLAQEDCYGQAGEIWAIS